MDSDSDLDIIKRYVQLALKSPPAKLSRDEISELKNAIKSLDERLVRLKQTGTGTPTSNTT